jgi:hypothetical protein
MSTKEAKDRLTAMTIQKSKSTRTRSKNPTQCFSTKADPSMGPANISLTGTSVRATLHTDHVGSSDRQLAHYRLAAGEMSTSGRQPTGSFAGAHHGHRHRAAEPHNKADGTGNSCDERLGKHHSDRRPAGEVTGMTPPAVISVARRITRAVQSGIKVVIWRS